VKVFPEFGCNYKSYNAPSVKVIIHQHDRVFIQLLKPG
jgi:hypothetical protein